MACADAPAELERQANAAARRRRDLAGRVADKHARRRRPRSDEPAGRYAAGAALDDARFRISEQRLGGGEEGLEIRACGPARRRARLRYERARRDPAEIAGREPRIQEAMKEARIG